MKKYSGRKLYTVGEAYRIMYQGLRTMPNVLRANRSGILRNDFTERLMLAVTAVNKCAMCSYAHTKMALETGMSIDEINAMLSGDLSDVPPDETSAILFAQHYADSRSKPSKEAWDSVVRQYGYEKSLAILGAIRMIMIGNTYGIPFGSLLARFSKKSANIPDSRSSVGYELATLGTLIIFMPCAIVCALVAAVVRLPLIDFK